MNNAEIERQALIMAKAYAPDFFGDLSNATGDPTSIRAQADHAQKVVIERSKAVIAALSAAGLVVVPRERLHDLRMNLMGAHHDMDDIAQETIERVMGQLNDLSETGDCESSLRKDSQ